MFSILRRNDLDNPMKTMKHTCVLFIFLVVMHVPHVQGATKYPPNLGGGNDGVDGSEFLKGTKDTPKLIIRSHCSRATTAATTVDMNLYVYQKDTAFKFSNIGPDDDKFVEYTCFLIDAEEFIDKKNVEKATSVTNCGNTASLTKVDGASAIDTTFKTRTYQTEISFKPTDGSYQCGGYKDKDKKAVFAVTCKRKEGYDKIFDHTFVVYYDAEKEACTSLQIDTKEVQVSNPPTVNHNNQRTITFKAYTNFDITNVPWPNGPQSVNGAHTNNIKEISTGVVKLGTSIYLEMCLINPSKPTDTNYNQFFNDGFEPIGIYVKKCTASNDATAGTLGISADTPVTFIENGCGKGVNPMEMLGKDGTNSGREFMYVKDSTDSTLDWLRSPNCFRTSPTEAVSFARADSDDEAVTVYTCEIDYCFASTDTKCFGTRTKDRQGYPTCARKRREVNHTLTGYPKKVSLSMRIALPGYEKAHAGPCQESMLLVGISAMLSVVFFVTLIVGGVMTYNLKSFSLADDDSSTSSMMGVVNKGYFH